MKEPVIMRTVSVTRGDIVRGKPGQQDACPIALATRRLLRTKASIWAEPEYLGGVLISRWDGRSKVLRPIGRMPPVAHRWMEAFDEGTHVDPIRIPLSMK